MSKQFRVRVDVAKLHANLERFTRRRCTEAEVEKYLRDSGVVRQPDGTFLVSEEDFHFLAPDEVLSCEPAP